MPRSDANLRESVALLAQSAESLARTVEKHESRIVGLENAALSMRVDRLERMFFGVVAAVGLETLGIIGAIVVWLLTRNQPSTL